MSVTASDPVSAGPLPSRRPALAVVGALAAVYVIWGSTYFAMHVGLESFPPLLLGGIRFLVAGTLLYGVLRARAVPGPCRRGWAAAGITGFLLLTLGNGAVVFAQQWVSSSVASIVVATMPLWAALFAWCWGQRPSAAEVGGMLLGFAGVAALHAGGALAGRGAGALAILVAPVSWALGSIWSRRLPLPEGAMAVAAQMLCGGALMLALGLARGERIHAAPSLASGLALAYLVVFGSLVGFSAYAYLLRTTRSAVATSYAYVNPLVAVGLGVGLGGERVGLPTVAAAGVILAGVVVLLAVPARRAG